MIPTALKHKTRQTTEAEITEDDMHVFTKGACYVLAREISSLTGWPIHCFKDDHREPNFHAFVVPQTGWRLDVEGLSRSQDHDKRWEWALLKQDKRWQRKSKNFSQFSYEQIVKCRDRRNNGFVHRQERHAERAAQIAPLLISLANDPQNRL